MAVPSKPKTDAIIEAETPINCRTLSKALNPPVTIKNFFKAKPKADSDAENKPSFSGTTSLSEIKNHCEFNPIIQIEDSSCDGKDDCTEEKAGLPFSDEPRDLTVIKNGPCQNTTRKHTAKNSVSITSKSAKTKTSLKRSSSSLSGNVSKKSKQTSILTSFASKNFDGRVAATKDIKCPICATIFEQGTSNEELNKHIDNCLIE